MTPGKIPNFTRFLPEYLKPLGYRTYHSGKWHIKFVTGKRSLTEYPDFLKTLETTFKYKLYVDEGTKQIKEQGFVK